MTEPTQAVADLACALGAAGTPAGQDQAPVAVVGEVVAGADLLDPAGERQGRLDVAAQLVGDRRVGQRDGQAVGVLCLLAAADRPVAPVQRLLVAAEQPEGVRGPGPCVHLDPGAEQVRRVVLAQFVGQCEVRQRLLVPPQAGPRPGHREVRLPGGVGGQGAQLQAAVGDLVGLGDVPLHVTDAEQPHEDKQLQPGVAPLLGKVASTFEDVLQFGRGVAVLRGERSAHGQQDGQLLGIALAARRGLPQ